MARDIESPMLHKEAVAYFEEWILPLLVIEEAQSQAASGSGLTNVIAVRLGTTGPTHSARISVSPTGNMKTGHNPLVANDEGR